MLFVVEWRGWVEVGVEPWCAGGVEPGWWGAPDSAAASLQVPVVDAAVVVGADPAHVLGGGGSAFGEVVEVVFLGQRDRDGAAGDDAAAVLGCGGVADGGGGESFGLSAVQGLPSSGEHDRDEVELA